MRTYVCYMVSCGDGSLYTGSTSNLEQRINQHQNRAFPTCYTAKRFPLTLVWQEVFGNPEDMVAAERKLKGWSAKKKWALIRGELDLLPALAKKTFASR